MTEPIEREVTDWDEYTGHLQSPQAANVAARISGFITETPFKEGSLVKQGDVLFVIDDRPFKADLENKKSTVKKDEAQLALAEANIQRSSDLLKTKTIAQQDFDSAKAQSGAATAQLAADQAAVESSRLSLEWTQVTAPPPVKATEPPISSNSICLTMIAKPTPGAGRIDCGVANIASS